MKLNKLSFLFSLAAGFLLSISTFAQTEAFNDASVEYTFNLPETVWKMTTKPSATSPNVEYVYGERQSGHLEVRKTTLKPDAAISDLISDEEQKLQFLNGYVAGKQEDFKGSFGGKVFNYEFVRSGRNMSGRFYFLKVDDKTVYILRFTGFRDKLRSIRNQTDSIARTFDLKKGK
jgi:hypothetical protein